MHTEFKTVTGTVIRDLEQHIEDQFEKSPELTIHVGTDSINTADRTTYATVIAFRYPSKGVHLLFRREYVPKIRDKWQRLYREAELSVEAANWINDNTNYKVHCIDLDYNRDARYFSNTVISAGAGLALGFNHNYTVKPQEQVAARAADNFCKG